MERDGDTEYLAGKKYETLLHDKYRSMEAMQEAANNEDVDAMRDVSICYLHGTCGFEKDLKKAKTFLEKVVESERWSPNDLTNLAVLYDDLPENPQPTNPMKAFPLYRKAAELGHRHAQINLAGMYLCGIDDKLDVDLAEAEKWYGLAAGEDKDDDDMKNSLWRILTNAMRGFGTAGILKNKARFELWKMYSTNDNSRGEPQHVKAVKYLQIAAEEGFLDAEREYGKIFLDGTFGFRKDKDKAKFWLMKAAEKGDPQSKELLQTVSVTERTIHADAAANSSRAIEHYKSPLPTSHDAIDNMDFFDHFFEARGSEEDINNFFKPGSFESIKLEQLSDYVKMMKRCSIDDILIKNPKIFHEDMFLRYPNSPTAARYLKAFRYFKNGVQLLTENSDPVKNLEGVRLVAKGFITEGAVSQTFGYIFAAKHEVFLEIAKTAVAANNHDFLSRYYLANRNVVSSNVTTANRIYQYEVLAHMIECEANDTGISKKILHHLYAELGVLYMLTDQHHRSLDSFQKAYAMKGIEDDDNEALRGVAIEKSELGDNESAIELYKEYLRSTPRCGRKYAAVHYNMALIYFMKKQFQLAFYHYEQGLKAEKDRLAFFDDEDNNSKKCLRVVYDILSARVCNNPDCQAPDSKDLKQCPCKLVYYCGVPCQKAHRPVHKKVCTSTKRKT
ncbi:uncharacterized protein [Ptychodera flava]|uniref:uncharacterized protein n=1 Tax=Ptychodera flava TaxID=63121 RepID=UPI00396A7983